MKFKDLPKSLRCLFAVDVLKLVRRFSKRLLAYKDDLMQDGFYEFDSDKEYNELKGMQKVLRNVYGDELASNFGKIIRAFGVYSDNSDTSFSAQAKVVNVFLSVFDISASELKDTIKRERSQYGIR